MPGAKAVFEKFADYVPRAGEGLLARRRQEACWSTASNGSIMPDPATASAALQNGEVDWWENPISDLVPVLQEEPQRRGRHRRSARQHRHLPHEPPASAVQRREGAARGADGARPGRVHARAGRRRQQPVEAAARLFHARTRRSTPRRAARSSRASATSRRPRSCWPRAATRASRSPAWWRRTSRSPRRRATSPRSC